VRHLAFLVNSLLGVNGFAGRGELKESAKGLDSFNTHDEALQLFALILADDIAAQRREFYGDFFLAHWISVRRGVWLSSTPRLSRN
jgi:hypothetical protein